MVTLQDIARIEGTRIVSVATLAAKYAALGYTLDRSMDARSMARYVTGPHAGLSYPCVTTGLRESDTGRSAWHVDARRDDNFKAMQRLRGEVVAISRGALLEV